jgi:hypothetical protein
MIGDSLQSPVYDFTPESASEYIDRLIEMESLWRKSDDALKYSLSRLIANYNTPYDSIRKQLLDFDFASINYDSTFIIANDTLPLYWLDKNLFFIDTTILEQSPYIVQKTITYKTLIPDSTLLFLMDSLPKVKEIMESLIRPLDTVVTKKIDFAYLKSRGIQLHHIENQKIIPPIVHGR